jgi:hypothetical protein
MLNLNVNYLLVLSCYFCICMYCSTKFEISRFVPLGKTGEVFNFKNGNDVVFFPIKQCLIIREVVVA